jgi:putative ABC transport system ATP-binding protein
VSVELGAGELVGVVADPAAARSLVDLLALERVPDAGVVELDGFDVHDLHPDDVRRALLVEAHDGDLFEGSLAGNVAARAASPAHAESAMAAAAVDEVAANLPGGEASVLPARGTSLSGGQRQRVALGRALATDAPVLVLHDPTSAIDAVTEQRIALGLRSLRAGRTTVVVTTSATLLAATDRAVLLVEGRLAAEGTHAELVGDARYRELVLS